MQYTDEFKSMVAAFMRLPTEFPNVRPASVAQFILESGRGSSLLAREHRNFAGMKWRPEMAGVATKKLVIAPSETADFCSFESLEKFAEGYWIFLNRAPYEGWKAHADDPYDFIGFVGRIWAADPAYTEKVQNLIGEAEALIATLREPHVHTDGAPCCGGMIDPPEPMAHREKPAVRWDPSPFNWSRGGTRIDTVVMHYTTSRNLQGTIDWFKSPNNIHKTAAHYVIGRDGTIVQMVKDADACTHGNSQNRRSIGIEHSAAPGDPMTEPQERASVALVRWLMQEYAIAPERVIGHKCAPRATSCPGDLFAAYGATSASDCAAVTRAIQTWVRERVLAEGVIA
ncbi:N-acetylmuramoyl-L-alanine amidase [Lutibaculum baratangense]|uniref:N-acetylmuramoyl-L-alanine amidase n=1 Tax=Lutibaculum baratangense AMV1 TaxID=631454 RepID=V4QSH1_9HYPH|nr:N-acetylmuramoyl-L-alanine amidase [Lutibaculum baratangense]ESR22732.1 hypothetical protein N177_3869 [Lutibaculum baratangense AMV1]